MPSSRPFGRATVYQFNRPFNVHAHREGHLIFHVGGTPGRSTCRAARLLTEDSSSRSIPGSRTISCRPTWEMAQSSSCCTSMPNGLPGRRAACASAAPVQTHRRARQQFAAAAAMVCGAPSLEASIANSQLIDSCYEESWQQSEAAPDERAAAAITDFRVRKSIKLLSEGPRRDRTRRSPAHPAFRGRISTGCSGPRPVSPPTCTSTRC